MDDLEGYVTRSANGAMNGFKGKEFLDDLYEGSLNRAIAAESHTYYACYNDLLDAMGKAVSSLVLFNRYRTNGNAVFAASSLIGLYDSLNKMVINLIDPGSGEVPLTNKKLAESLVWVQKERPDFRD